MLMGSKGCIHFNMALLPSNDAKKIAFDKLRRRLIVYERILDIIKLAIHHEVVGCKEHSFEDLHFRKAKYKKLIKLVETQIEDLYYGKN